MNWKLAPKELPKRKQRVLIYFHPEMYTVGEYDEVNKVFVQHHSDPKNKIIRLDKGDVYWTELISPIDKSE